LLIPKNVKRNYFSIRMFITINDAVNTLTFLRSFRVQSKKWMRFAFVYHDNGPSYLFSSLLWCWHWRPWISVDEYSLGYAGLLDNIHQSDGIYLNSYLLLYSKLGFVLQIYDLLMNNETSLIVEIPFVYSFFGHSKTVT